VRAVLPTSGRQEACGVCGRTILSGESTREYVTPDGDEVAVCDLCRDRVEAAGWSRAGQQVAAAPERRREPFGMRGRRWLRQRVEEARARTDRPEADEAERPGMAPRAPSPEAAPTPRRRRLPRYEPPDRRLRRAIDQFNASEHRRTVAGLTRSLGRPRVAAVTGPEAPDEVRLTVAWELSWYQFEVVLADERTTVRSLAKGDDISELREDDRAWNAHADEDGKLELEVGGNGGSAA
jgi:hypothetical protein